LSLVVALVTLLAVFNAARITQRVPPMVLGLALGAAFYYYLAAGWPSLLGPTLGAIPVSVPDGRELASMMTLPLVPGFYGALPGIVVGAASIALVSSLDVLISAKIVENLSRRRGNSTQELISMGAANLLAPLLGGIAGSISLAATTTAFKGGARNSLALLVHAALFLVFVPLLAPVIGFLPRVVIAALVFYAGMQLFDKWSFELLQRVVRRRAIHWPSISIDLAVILLVAAIALAGEIVGAVFLGVGVTVVVFTLRMSRKVIRREQYGDVMQSRRARNVSDAALLAANGRRILALELEGPMFFASAEALHNRTESAIGEGVRHIVLDFTRVTELDSTGARMIVQADERLRAAQCRMVLCGAEGRAELAALLVDHRVAEAFTRDRIFPDLDRALEACENLLLAELRGSALAAEEYPFERLDLVRNVDPADMSALRAALVRREYAGGETVFRQGDEGNALFVIARGSATVWLKDAASGVRRLMTFSEGTFFGEMALLDRERRSATVSADEDLVCYVLERSKFEELAASRPRAGLAVLANLGREISLRMRRTNRALLELG
jgi:anti-anti-sigma factor